MIVVLLEKQKTFLVRAGLFLLSNHYDEKTVL